ncbi:MAG: hypothetical protein CM15mP88_3080 [Pseudomonadota bacterium]|nr:MAG: hypothetical protein CM15mP88_3080 [Pseudomonadota bacterium]
MVLSNAPQTADVIYVFKWSSHYPLGYRNYIRCLVAVKQKKKPMREKVISGPSTIKKLITIHSNQVFSNQKTFRPKNLSGQLLRESPRFP